MSKAKIAIGFLDGEICIRYNCKDFVTQDKKVYLPILKDRIDHYIIHSDILSISTIILSALKDVTKIDNLFIRPNFTSVVPDDDPLYRELENYVRNNILYIQKKESIILERKEKNDLIQKNSENYKLYLRYVNDTIKERERVCKVHSK